MEAVTIAGIAVVAVGGYYSVIDFMNDFGLLMNKSRPWAKLAACFRNRVLTSQRRVQKMTRMYI